MKSHATRMETHINKAFINRKLNIDEFRECMRRVEHINELEAAARQARHDLFKLLEKKG